MLLSDRDITTELGAGRIGLDPYEPEMIQPSSIDVRLDRFFRLSSPADKPYGSAAYSSRYQGQRGPTASRSFLGFHRTDVSGSTAGEAAIAGGEPVEKVTS